MRIRTLATAALIALSAVAPGAGRASSQGECPAGHVADGDACDWRGVATRISGLGVVDKGEYIYSDYVHDDYGANIDGLHYGDLDPGNPVTGMEYPNLRDPASPRNGATGDNLLGRLRWTGDYGYPPADPATDPFTYFDVADMIEFRTAVDNGALHYYVKLGSLIHPDDTGVEICLDTDRNQATGGTMSVGSPNLNEKLGCEYVVALWGSGGSITDMTKKSSANITVAANTKENFLEADVPLPAGLSLGTWRTYVASGRWDPANAGFAFPAPTTAQSVAPGALLFGPRFYDILFVPYESNSWWRDTTQANDLARHDISNDNANINMTWLAQGLSRPRPQKTGLINFQYDAVPLGPGEGQQWNSGGLGSINYIYRGAIQPGMVFLPSNYYTRPHPRRFMYFFHCLNCNQNIWPLGVEDAATPGQQHIHDGQVGTGHVQKVANDYDMIVAGCLQRGEGGPSSYGATIGERDLFDVFNWINDRYSLDTSRMTFSGMSMGGSTTNTQMTLHPDMIVAALSHSAASSPARMGNIRNVFYTQVAGDTGLDGTSAVTGRQAAAALANLGYQHYYMEYLLRAHDFNLVYESWPILKGLTGGLRLDPNPARVTYQLDASTEAPALNLNHDHAYWVSGLSIASGSTSGSIDATALPLADKLPHSISRLTGHFLNLQSGNNAFIDWTQWNTDLTGHGPGDYEPGWTPGPDVTVTNAVLPAPPGAGTNAFAATLTALAAATLDMPRMSIDTSQQIAATVSTTVATALTLAGSFSPSVSVTIDGAPATVGVTAGGLIVQIPAGSHTVVVG